MINDSLVYIVFGCFKISYENFVSRGEILGFVRILVNVMLILVVLMEIFVGYFIFDEFNSKKWKIMDFAVHPAFQRERIGMRMMDYILDPNGQIIKEI